MGEMGLGVGGGGDCQEPIVGAGRVTHLHSTQHFRKISNFFHKLFREFFQYLFPFHFNPTSSLILPPWHSIYLTNLSALILCPTLYTAQSFHVLSFTLPSHPNILPSINTLSHPTTLPSHAISQPPRSALCCSYSTLLPSSLFLPFPVFVSSQHPKLSCLLKGSNVLLLQVCPHPLFYPLLSYPLPCLQSYCLLPFASPTRSLP